MSHCRRSISVKNLGFRYLQLIFHYLDRLDNASNPTAFLLLAQQLAQLRMRKSRSSPVLAKSSILPPCLPTCVKLHTLSSLTECSDRYPNLNLFYVRHLFL